jgi:hypothetical protein
MNIWLCPVKPKNWRIIKKVKLFGAPKHAAKVMNQLQLGDLLIFHVLKPINGIVALGEVESTVFEDYKNIWGKNRYPLRVKIKFIQAFPANEKNPIPLSLLLGEVEKQEGLVIEPYLKNIWLTKISENQYSRLINFPISHSSKRL